MTRTALNRGDYLMNKAADDLKKMGYIIEKAKKVRWQSQDFFNCWDIMAVYHKEVTILPMPYKLTPIRFVQVSSKPLYDRGTEYKNKLKAFPSSSFWSKEYWWGVRNKEWKVTIL
jgi:hypothetical protein